MAKSTVCLYYCFRSTRLNFNFDHAAVETSATINSSLYFSFRTIKVFFCSHVLELFKHFRNIYISHIGRVQSYLILSVPHLGSISSNVCSKPRSIRTGYFWVCRTRRSAKSHFVRAQNSTLLSVPFVQHPGLQNGSQTQKEV